MVNAGIQDRVIFRVIAFYVNHLCEEAAAGRSDAPPKLQHNPDAVSHTAKETGKLFQVSLLIK